MNHLYSLFRAFFRSLVPPSTKYLCPVMDRHAIFDAMIDRMPDTMAERYADLEHETAMVTLNDSENEEPKTRMELLVRFPDQESYALGVEDLPMLLFYLSAVTKTLWAGWEDMENNCLKFAPVSTQKGP